MRLVLVCMVAIAIIGGYLALSLTGKTEKVLERSLATIEIADSSEERMQGLSGRKEIPNDYGMLFIFPEKGSYGFWMKDMLVAIDILWLSDDGVIIGSESAVSPDTYPKTFHPPQPVRFVLEIRGGLAKEKGWEVGTHLSLPLP